MTSSTESPRAWWLTREMAKSCGTSLSRALFEGLIGRSEMARIVDRCESCGQPDRCHVWLQLAAPGAQPAPDFCPNRESIDSLQRV